MPLLGNAALAMWWDMAPAMKSEFEHWHSHEHFPERLCVPGFERASRFTSAQGEGVFVMYELTTHDVLSSPAYARHLNAPTPWSARMMPHHRHMVRSQCRVVASSGGSVAQCAMTLRFDARPGQAQELEAHLRHLGSELSARPGLVGAHLLRHEKPALGETTEQRIRASADGHAAWVFVVTGYEAEVLDALRHQELAEPALTSAGAQAGVLSGIYRLSHSAVGRDTATRPS